MSRQFFDRATVPIAAFKIHAVIRFGGVVAQHLFDLTQLLEELLPGRAADFAQAGDQLRQARSRFLRRGSELRSAELLS